MGRLIRIIFAVGALTTLCAMGFSKRPRAGFVVADHRYDPPTVPYAYQRLFQGAQKGTVH